MARCLYLTNIKPSRKNARTFTDWLGDTYPDCSFTEYNVGKRSFPPQNGGRYQGRVEGPEEWGEATRATDRLAVLDAARRMQA